MSFLIRLSLIVALCLTTSNADDLLVGLTSNAMIISDYIKIPPKTQSVLSKTFFYNTNDATKIIKGVSIIDLDKSKARATIMAGGVGSTYVNIKLKGKRGDGLHFHIQIYV